MITVIVFTDRILWHSLVKKTTPQEIMNSTICKSIYLIIFMTYTKIGLYSSSLSDADSWAKNISKTALLKFCTKNQRCTTNHQRCSRNIAKNSKISIAQGYTDLLKNHVVLRTVLLKVALLKDLL